MVFAFPGCNGGDTSGPSPNATATVEVSPATISLEFLNGTTQLSATARNSSGNPIAGKQATWSSSAPAVANVDANGLVTARSAGTATVTASIDGRSGTATVAVVPRVTQLVIAAGPANTTAGASFSVRVEARDAGGTPVSTFTDAVTLVLAANSQNATINGTATIAAVGGVATFPSLTVNVAGSAYRVVARSGAINSAPGAPFDVGAGPFAKLVFVAPPPASVEGRLRMAPAVRVETRDAFDNVVNGPAVTMRLSAAPWQNTRLGGVLTQNPSNGVAAFPDLSVDRPGTGYRLEAQAGTVRVESAPFAVTLTFTSVAVGGWNSQGSGFTCGIATAGTWCWGVNSEGQLGSPRATLVEVVPFPVDAPASFVQVSAGVEHACGLTSDGEVWCWGNGVAGQLGNGGLSSSSSPVRVIASGGSGGRIYTAVEAGYRHTCGLVASAVYCWGRNDYGQTGSPGTVGTNQPQPARITNTGVAPLDFVQISAGHFHTCGITSATTAWCWGAAFNGGLGDGQESTARSTPTQVLGSGVSPLRFTSVSAGPSRTCALTTGLSLERVYCWGSNSGGFLGFGSGASQGSYLVPTQVPAPAGVGFRSVSLGYNTVCATDTSNALWCWGRGTSGEIGNGQLANQSAPAAAVTPAGGVGRLSFGGVHGCAIAIAGGVYCWGDGVGGSLGDGTSSSRAMPTRIVQ